jgi:hypothetical protein
VYELSVDLNIYLFGLSKNPRPIQFNAHAPIELTGIISGGCFGIREPKKSRLYFHPDILCSNDFFVSMLNAYLNRKCLVDKRFAFISTQTFKGKGGNAEFRQPGSRQADYEVLKRLFGDSIQIKRGSKLAASKDEFAITCKIDI